MHRVLPSTNQIPQRFILRVGHGNGGEFAGSMQPRQQQCIPAVRLDTIGRLTCYTRWCDHYAVEAALSELTDQAVPARTGLMTQAELCRLTQFGQRLGDRADPMRGRAKKPRFFAGAPFRVRDGDGVLVYVQTNLVLCALHDRLL